MKGTKFTLKGTWRKCDVYNGPRRRYGILTGGDDWKGGGLQGEERVCRGGGRGKFRSLGETQISPVLVKSRELAESRGGH